MAIGVQFAPAVSHRSHPIEYAVGDPVQLPPVAVSCEPTCAVPLSSGSEVAILVGAGALHAPDEVIAITTGLGAAWRKRCLEKPPCRTS